MLELFAAATAALSFSPAVEAADTPQPSVLQTALGDERLETLVAAVGAAGLTDALSGDGPFTIFAPTDDAFAGLPDGAIERLLDPHNRQELVDVLTYHVVAEDLDGGALRSRVSARSLNGQRIDFRDGEALSIEGANLISSAIDCANGTVYLVDSVLLPEGRDLVEVASQAGSFGTLLAAVEAAGLAPTLLGEGPFTVLAPTDEAFAALPHGTVERLLDPHNQSELVRVLANHVIPARVYANEAVRLTSATTLAETTQRFTIEEGQLRVGGARVLANDIEAANGVIHVIDQVLVPAAPQPLLIGYQFELPSEELAEYLGIDRHASARITAVIRDACPLEVDDIVVAVDGAAYSDSVIDAAKRRAGLGGTVRLDVLRRGRLIELDCPVVR